MKDHVSSLSKDDLVDLVKTFRIPLNMHPRLPDPTLTIDRLTHDTIGTSRAILEYLTWRHSHSCISNDLPIDGYNQNDVERLCARVIHLREMKEEVLVRPGLSSVWSNRKCDPVFRRKDDNSDAKVVKEPHHLPTPLLDSVPQHTTAAADEGALFPLPTPDKVATAQPDPRLARRSQGPYKGKARIYLDVASELNQPSKKRKLRKKVSEVGSSNPEVEQTKGLGDADISNFWVEFEGSLERGDSTHVKAISVHLSHLGKRLRPPPSSSAVAVSELSQIGTSVRAATHVRGIARKGVVWSATSGFAGKPGFEDVWRCMDPLDTLAHSALSHDVEYDQIPEDDFATASRSEEIDLTFFTPCSWDLDVCRRALDRTRRTESLLHLELSNRFSIFSALLVSHGMELNTRYTNLVASKARTQEKLKRKSGYVKDLRSEVTTLDKKLERAQRDYSVLDQENKELRLTDELARTDAKISDQALVVRNLQNELALERSKSQEYKEVADGLRAEATRFFGSGVECLVRMLLLSDEFHVALAHVASLGISSGVERGLRMERTDAEFEVAVENVSNFSVGAEAEFNKALAAFPSITFPFLGKVAAAAEGALSEVTKILLDKLVRSATPVFSEPPVVSEALDQAPIDHVTHGSPPVV
ncbi:hypothetical protein Tco_1124809 [Tanacetum coccineum]|uniref:Uncharacterized protein n=1 Tax=Tanacetum coccineum TaxID=301880 RepID=A0ABQ5J7A6_9ASTR